MRRAELVRAVRTVLHALRDSRVHEALLEVGRGARGEQASYALLAALRAYTVQAAAFGPAERRVVQAMELQALDDPAWWARVVGGGEGGGPRAAEAATMAQSIRAAGTYLPRLAGLLSTEGLRRGAGAARRPTAPSPDGLELLEVVVIEPDGQRSSPMRLITALEAVWLLYDAAATLLRLPSNTLSVAGCDAGSDTSFDFLGLAPVVATVKEILVSVWDRVVFYRGRPSEARVEMIERSVPILARIARMREAGEVGPEQAELLRRGIVAGVKKFLDAGCTIPEIEASATHQARDLLAPSPKLLAGGPVPPA
jgi:hypothetical protein